MRAIVFGVLITLAGCAPGSDEPVAQAAPVPAAVRGAEATVASATTLASPVAAAAPASDASATSTGSATAPASPASPTAAASPAPTTAPEQAIASAPPPDAAQRAPKDLLTKDGVNYECSVPADCAVKDVGNCCGYYPACVNKDSPTFPEQVKAQCAKDGMSSVCGFKEIAGCDCIEGRCTALPGSGGATGELRKD